MIHYSDDFLGQHVLERVEIVYRGVLVWNQQSAVHFRIHNLDWLLALAHVQMRSDLPRERRQPQIA